MSDDPTTCYDEGFSAGMLAARAELAETIRVLQADRDVLAAEVRAWRNGCSSSQAFTEQAERKINRIVDNTDASGALDRAKEAK